MLEQYYYHVIGDCKNLAGALLSTWINFNSSMDK